MRNSHISLWSEIDELPSYESILKKLKRQEINGKNNYKSMSNTVTNYDRLIELNYISVQKNIEKLIENIARRKIIERIERNKNDCTAKYSQLIELINSILLENDEEYKITDARYTIDNNIIILNLNFPNRRSFKDIHLSISKNGNQNSMHITFEIPENPINDDILNPRYGLYLNKVVFRYRPLDGKSHKTIYLTNKTINYFNNISQKKNYNVPGLIKILKILKSYYYDIKSIITIINN